MKKLALLVVMTSQIMVGADTILDGNIMLRALNFTQQQYQELEELQEDSRAVSIICKIKGKTPVQLANSGLADLKKIVQGFNSGTVSGEQLCKILENMLQDIDDVMAAVSRAEEAERKIACAAMEINILYELAKDRYVASIIKAREGMHAYRLAKGSSAALMNNVDWFEQGLVSDTQMQDVAKYIVENTHRIIDSLQPDAPYLFTKGKYGRRKSI